MDKNLILKNDDLEIYDCPPYVLEINGTKYSYELFKALGIGGLQLDIPFIIANRGNETVTIHRLSDEELKYLSLKTNH